MKQVELRDIYYQMLKEKSSAAGMNIQNYLGDLIINDYKSEDNKDGEENRDI